MYKALKVTGKTTIIVINPVLLSPKSLLQKLNAIIQYPQWTKWSRATNQATPSNMNT